MKKKGIERYNRFRKEMAKSSKIYNKFNTICTVMFNVANFLCLCFLPKVVSQFMISSEKITAFLLIFSTVNLLALFAAPFTFEKNLKMHLVKRFFELFPEYSHCADFEIVRYIETGDGKWSGSANEKYDYERFEKYFLECERSSLQYIERVLEDDNESPRNKRKDLKKILRGANLKEIKRMSESVSGNAMKLNTEKYLKEHGIAFMDTRKDKDGIYKKKA